MTREEAIKMLKEDGCGYCTWQSINPYECENKECKLKVALDMAIKALEQEPKTGHWIRWYVQKEYDGYTENIPHCKCSECGEEYDPHSSQFIKYCNECGAKMVEPQESEKV